MSIKVSAWVDLGSKEIEFNLDAKDIRIALSEAFANCDPKNYLHDDDGPNIHTVNAALNSIACFLNGMDDSMIAKITPKARETVAIYLRKAAERFNG